ncbi:hypothetical protein RHAB21_00696 [Pseudorhizobium halotolerans]|uniref:Uncharacterized protein n=1 Tax=Pseudorhizobium halotolerans TaxID=1233081 RepID=A0ABN7JZG7_9HYPH|nr:hypothetical protein [Pseudorhizobium halotolerans]CAD7055322.1 hypothetical protein RHAB21_00696 [Pseudorhizobium halotolerans]
MKTPSFERILEVLIEEYRNDCHEVFEQEGVHYARLPIDIDPAGGVLTEMNLTRLADLIGRKLS